MLRARALSAILLLSYSRVRRLGFSHRDDWQLRDDDHHQRDDRRHRVVQPRCSREPCRHQQHYRRRRNRSGTHGVHFLRRRRAGNGHVLARVWQQHVRFGNHHQIRQGLEQCVTGRNWISDVHDADDESCRRDVRVRRGGRVRWRNGNRSRHRRKVRHHVLAIRSSLAAHPSSISSSARPIRAMSFFIRGMKSMFGQWHGLVSVTSRRRRQTNRAFNQAPATIRSASTSCASTSEPLCSGVVDCPSTRSGIYKRSSKSASKRNTTIVLPLPLDLLGHLVERRAPESSGTLPATRPDGVNMIDDGNAFRYHPRGAPYAFLRNAVYDTHLTVPCGRT